MPTDPARLRAIAAVSGVESIAYARKDQKVERAARDAAGRYAKQLPGLPVVVSAFDKAALEELRAWLTTAKATVGRVDADAALDFGRRAGRAPRRAGRARHRALRRAEPARRRAATTSACRSWAWTTSGPAASARASPGRRSFRHSRHRLHGGRRRRDHASGPEQERLRRNFTSDAAGVWNDQHGHGTHVLGRSPGTGTGAGAFPRRRHRRWRLATRIRAAKIWNSTGSGQNAWLRNAMDFMDDATACGSARAPKSSTSAAAPPASMNGTDASRASSTQGLGFRQAYIVCGGNTGQGAGTIWSPGVAKNALTVGNVQRQHRRTRSASLPATAASGRPATAA